MFDVDKFNMADLMRGSDDYKIIRSGPVIYIFPADVDFDLLNTRDEYVTWLRHAAIVIDTEGQVRKNRFGGVREEEW